MSIRITGLATLAAAMLLATGASSQAAYTLTATAVTTVPAAATIGGTTFTFTPTNGGTQTGSTASDFNVIDVGVSSTTAPPASDSGVIAISQNYTITGNGFTETATLLGMLTLKFGSSGGIVSTFAGTVTVLSGSGFTVTFDSYAPPSPGSGGTGGTTGNISIEIVPLAAVPEPASFAMVGLGLLSVGGFALRRRMARSAS